MKAKPRGSVSGLLEFHSKSRASSTAAMLMVIGKLRIEKPFVKWSYKEVWSGADLKSQIALNSPWNIHIRLEIDEHNERLERDSHGGSELMVPSEKALLRSYKVELKALREQRDQALARIAQYCADADYHKKRCADLEKSVDRLKSQCLHRTL